MDDGEVARKPEQRRDGHVGAVLPVGAPNELVKQRQIGEGAPEVERHPQVTPTSPDYLQPLRRDSAQIAGQFREERSVDVEEEKRSARCGSCRGHALLLLERMLHQTIQMMKATINTTPTTMMMPAVVLIELPGWMCELRRNCNRLAKASEAVSSRTANVAAIAPSF
jgi:hypothetical protein